MNLIIKTASALTGHYLRHRLRAPKGVTIPVCTPQGRLFWEAVAAQMAVLGCPPGVEVATNLAEYVTVIVPDLALPS